MKNIIERHNENNNKSSKKQKVKLTLTISVILIIGLTSSFYRNNALNEGSLVTVGKVTQVKPNSIYFELLIEEKTLTGSYNFSRGNHQSKKIGDLLIIQVSSSEPKYKRVLTKSENVDSSRYFGEVIKDIKPNPLKWWQDY